MSQTLAELGRVLAGSQINELVVYLLGNVPGWPPIVQTVHLLSVTAIMGSIVLIDLRLLGLALPSQTPADLVRRLIPWTWWALPFLAVSGGMFFLARPGRYLVNPVFGLKYAMLAPALVLTALVQRMATKDREWWEGSRGRRLSVRVVAAFSLLLWIGVVLAGRWIAYADYLFPPE